MASVYIFCLKNDLVTRGGTDQDREDREKAHKLSG